MHVVSLRVLAFEADRCASDPLMSACVARRRAMLERMYADEGSAAAHAARLETAIADEKARSRDAKESGRTKEALAALRRAKIMMEELDDPSSPVKRAPAVT